MDSVPPDKRVPASHSAVGVANAGGGHAEDGSYSDVSRGGSGIVDSSVGASLPSIIHQLPHQQSSDQCEVRGHHAINSRKSYPHAYLKKLEWLCQLPSHHVSL